MAADSAITEPDVAEVAAALRVSIGLLLRRLRQVQPAGELSLPETSALTRLDRSGPATSSARPAGSWPAVPTRTTAGGPCCR